MTVAVQSVRTSYQTPLLLEQTPALKAPRRMDPLHGFLRGVQDDGLDVVTHRSSARQCEREFNELDRMSDNEIKAGMRLVAMIAMMSTEPEIARLADQALARFERGLALDQREREPLTRHWSIFDRACESGRRIVSKIESLLSPSRQRAGKGQVTR